MTLVFRRFRSRARDEERVQHALHEHAVALIRDRAVDVVAVCQRADLPHDILWIEQQNEARFPGVDHAPPAAWTGSDLMEFDGPAIRAEFVNGAYQFPVPPCRMWVAETSDERIARTLIGISRRAGSDRRVCGVSVYRTIEEQSRLIGFVALALDVIPDVCFETGTGAHSPRALFYPLRVKWTVGRLAVGRLSAPPFGRYPSAASSARLGVVPCLRRQGQDGMRDEIEALR